MGFFSQRKQCLSSVHTALSTSVTNLVTGSPPWVHVQSIKSLPAHQLHHLIGKAVGMRKLQLNLHLGTRDADARHLLAEV